NSGWSPPSTPDLPDIDRQRLSQVWFSGMHSDVGGGYSQDGLAYLTLDWMMDRAEVYGLRLKSAERARLGLFASPFDKLNDSRKGVAGYYRYKPRKVEDLYRRDPYKPSIVRDVSHAVRALRKARGARDAKSPGAAAPRAPVPLIHESVFERIKTGIDGYAPIV